MSGQLTPFIPGWLDDAGLGPAEFRLYCNLRRRADNETGIAWPSWEVMMQTCGLSRATISRALKTLIERKLIEPSGKPFGGSMRYRVLVPIVSPEALLETANRASHETPIVSPVNSNRASGETPIVSPEALEGYPMKVIQRRVSKEGTQRELFEMSNNLPFESGEFREAWGDWLNHLSEKPKGKRPTATALKSQLKKLGRMEEGRAIAALRHSVASNWQGIYEDPKYQPPEGRPMSLAQVLAYAESIGTPQAVATQFHDESDAAGWKDWKRNPIEDWQGALRAFAERRKSGGFRPRGNGTGPMDLEEAKKLLGGRAAYLDQTL